MSIEKPNIKDVCTLFTLLKETKNLTLESITSDTVNKYFVFHSVQIIGEAAHNIGEEIINKYKGKEYGDVKWGYFAELRHEIVHEYFEVDDEETEKVLRKIWQLITSGELAGLGSKIAKIIEVEE